MTSSRIPTSNIASFTFTYVRTFEDWVAYNIHCQRNLPINNQRGLYHKLMRRIAPAALALAFLGFIVIGAISGRMAISDYLILGMLGLGFGLMAMFNINVLAVKWALNRVKDEYADYLVEWTVTFSDYGMDSRANGFHIAVAWNRLKMVKVSKDHIFLYIYRMWGETIPIRLFEAPAKQEEFLKYLSTRIKHIKYEK